MKTKTLFPAISMLIVTICNFPSHAQTWTFGKAIAANNFTAPRTKMAKGAGGSVFVGSTFYDTVVIADKTYLPVNSDFFISKHDASGNLVWSITDKGLPNGNTPSSFQSVLSGLAADTSGNVFAVGGWGFTLNTADRFFLAKYDSSGVKKWNAWTKSAAGVAPLGICVGDSGSVFFTGHTANTITFYNADGSSAPNNALVAGGTGTEFLAKYSATGTFLWFKEYTNAFSTRASSLTATNDGIILCGTTGGGGTVDFGNSITAVVTALKFGAFVTKYDFDGKAQWVLKGEGDATPLVALTLDSAYDLTVAGSLYNGSIGTFKAPSPTVSGFVGKVTSKGEAKWVSFETAYKYNKPMGVALGEKGILVIGNALVNIPQWGNGAAVVTQRYDETGKLVAYDSALTDAYTNITADAMVKSNTGDIWLAGVFTGKLKKGSLNVEAPNLLKGNIYLAKIAATGGLTPASINDVKRGRANSFLLRNSINGRLIIQSQDGNHTAVSGVVKILSSSGTVVYSTTIIQKVTTEIDLKALPSGIYFVQFNSGFEIDTKKIIVQASAHTL